MTKFTKIFLCALIAAALAAPAAEASVKVSLKEISPFSYCSIRNEGAFSDMGEVINQLMSIMQGQNIHPAGNLLTIYHTTPQEENPMSGEWEVGFPVSSQIAIVQEPLKKQEWTHETVAAAVHVGAYENTGDTVTAIFDWMEEKGYVQTGPIVGMYLNMPDADTPPSRLRTEIWVPCREKLP